MGVDGGEKRVVRDVCRSLLSLESAGEVPLSKSLGTPNKSFERSPTILLFTCRNYRLRRRACRAFRLRLLGARDVCFLVKKKKENQNGITSGSNPEGWSFVGHHPV